VYVRSVDLVHDGAALARHLSHVEWPALTAAVGLHLGKRAARARAWQLLVRAAHPAEPLSYRAALVACMSALGVSSVLPVRGAELLRIALVRPRLPGASAATIAATLAAEAVLDGALAAVVLLAAASLGAAPAVAGIDDLVGLAERHPALVSTALLALTAAIVLVRRGSRRAGELARAFRLGIAVLGSRRAVGPVLIWQSASWLCRLGSVMCFLAAVGIDPAPRTVLLVVACQLVSALVPVPAVAAGAQHGLLIAGLAGTAGVEAALTLGIGMQATTLVVNAGVGLAALGFLAKSFRPRSLRAAVQP
jgi:hypothetical protein